MSVEDAQDAWTRGDANGNKIDIYWPCAGVGQSVPRS